MRHLILCAVASLCLVACGKKSSTDEDSVVTITVPLSGTWSGTGTETINSGSPTACSNISFSLTFTATTVTMGNTTSTCGGSTVTAPNATFNYASGVITYQGTNVGTISDSDLHLSYTDNSGNSFDSEIQLTDATHVTYTENDSGNGQTFSGTASLTHQ